MIQQLISFLFHGCRSVCAILIGFAAIEVAAADLVLADLPRKKDYLSFQRDWSALIR